MIVKNSMIFKPVFPKLSTIYTAVMFVASSKTGKQLDKQFNRFTDSFLKKKKKNKIREKRIQKMSSEYREYC